MIEEAAGTSMYETKREATTKLIEKKDAKVRETNTLLQEEVEPKLEKLRRERAAHLEFQKICRDIEYLTRIHISYRWLKQSEALKTIEATIEKLTKRIEEAKQNIIDNDAERERIKEITKELQHKIDNESGGELKAIEAELDTELKQEGKLSGKLKASQGEIDQEEKKLKALIKNIADDEKTLNSKEAEMAKGKDLFQELKEAEKRDALAYEEAQKKFEAVSQGLTTDEDGQASSLQDQLMRKIKKQLLSISKFNFFQNLLPPLDAKQSATEAQTTIKTSEMELRHCRNVLRQKENETQTNDAAYNKDKNLHDNLVTIIQGITNRLQSMEYEDGAFERLKERQNQLQAGLRDLQFKLGKAGASNFELQYVDPEPGFDRTKVRGMVGKLFNVLDERNCLALMMTAGGSVS